MVFSHPTERPSIWPATRVWDAQVEQAAPASSPRSRHLTLSCGPMPGRRVTGIAMVRVA